MFPFIFECLLYLFIILYYVYDFIIINNHSTAYRRSLTPQWRKRLAAVTQTYLFMVSKSFIQLA